jgi:hypothetical protein
MSKILLSTNELILKNIKNAKSVKYIINRGTGAGGAITNKNGLCFEEKTSIEKILTEKGYSKIIMNDKNKKCYYYKYNDIENNQDIIYFTKNGFKMYFREKFNICTYKEPDEGFLIIKNNNYHLKILEKKNQNVSGSVEEKLKTGNFTRKEYELMINNQDNQDNKFKVSFAFCVSKFLQDKFESKNIKYENIKKIMKEEKTELFYGDSDDYHDKLYKWIIN